MRRSVSTNGNGAFSGIPVRVPASAVPGKHYITAVQRHSGRSAQAPFLVNFNRDQDRHTPSRTAFNRYENVLSHSNVAGLGLRWSVPNGPAFTSPAVVNGVAYTAGVSALNAATGAKLWSSTLVLSFGSSPTVAGGVVYIGSEQRQRVRPQRSHWDNSCGASPPDRASISPLQRSPTAWSTSATAVPTCLPSTPPPGPNCGAFSTGALVNSSPAVANGVVYIGSNDGNLYGLNAATGAKLWRFTTAASIGGAPVVANGMVYVTANNGTLYAFALPRGVPAISRPAAGQLHPNHALRLQNKTELDQG